MNNKRHVFIIAEAGVNHNGDLDLARRLVDAAVDAGADAVKFQTFRAAKLASRSAPKAAYQKVQTDAAESQLAMLQKLELPWEWHTELQAHARRQGIEFLSTEKVHTNERGALTKPMLGGVMFELVHTEPHSPSP